MARSPKTILFIEDEPFYHQVYGAPLEKAGYTVTYALNGEEAMQLLEESSFDILIVDLIMPIMSGKRLMKALKKKGQRIVILTNLEGETDREDAMSGGASLFLNKSRTKPTALVKAIKELH